METGMRVDSEGVREPDPKEAIKAVFEDAKKRMRDLGCLGVIVLVICIAPFFLFWVLTAWIFERLARGFSESGQEGFGPTTRVLSLSLITTIAALSQLAYFVVVSFVFGLPRNSADLGAMFGGYSAFITSLSLVLLLLSLYVQSKAIRSQLERIIAPGMRSGGAHGGLEHMAFVFATLDPSDSDSDSESQTELQPGSSPDLYGEPHTASVRNLTQRLALNVEVFDIIVTEALDTEPLIQIVEAWQVPALPGQDSRLLRGRQQDSFGAPAVGRMSEDAAHSTSRWMLCMYDATGGELFATARRIRATPSDCSFLLDGAHQIRWKALPSHEGRIPPAEALATVLGPLVADKRDEASQRRG